MVRENSSRVRVRGRENSIVTLINETFKFQAVITLLDIYLQNIYNVRAPLA